MRLLTRVAATLAAMAVCGSVSAATVNLAQLDAELDTVFSQPIFRTDGRSPIDVRVSDGGLLINPRLSTINNTQDVVDLLFNPLPIPDVPGAAFVFIIQNVTFCSVAGSSLVGCAVVGGSRSAVALNAAKNPTQEFFQLVSSGAELFAHELGHNLGLRHRTGGLMNEDLNGSVSINRREAIAISNSPLVQFDPNSGPYIDLVAIRIAPAVPVPLPAGGLLLGGGLALLLLGRRKRAA